MIVSTQLLAVAAAGLLLSLGCVIRGAAAAGDATQIDPAEPRVLRAGNVRMKFQDGQLRYMRVGDREIVRRIYFALRDERWETIHPRFTQASLNDHGDGFEILLSAECRRESVDYAWTGRITGTPDGTITFRARGVAGADFSSVRIGLCVLFGSSLAGESFQTFKAGDGTGPSSEGTFPHLVSPDLVAGKFCQLRYRSPEGYQVSCALQGAMFDMEDQRNWGDSSFKAYAPLPYGYPQVKKGEALEETVIIKTGDLRAVPQRSETVHFRPGEPIAKAKVPKLVAQSDAFVKAPEFVSINRNRAPYTDVPAVTWSYTSETHLPDDDTIMENPSALLDQAATIRSFNPDAALRAGPIHLRRSSAPVSAWAAEVMKNLALAGVEEACFDIPGGADAVLNDIAGHAGAAVLAIDPVAEPGSGEPAWAIQALAVREGEKTFVWLINRTAGKSRAMIDGARKPGNVVLLDPGGPATLKVDASGAIELTAYQVVRVEMGG